MPRRRRHARHNPAADGRLDLRTRDYSTLEALLTEKGIEDEDAVIAAVSAVFAASEDGLISRAGIIKALSDHLRATRPTGRRREKRKTERLVEEAQAEEVDAGAFDTAVAQFTEELNIDPEYLGAFRSRKGTLTTSDKAAASVGVGRYDIYTIARAALLGRQITTDDGEIDTDAIRMAMNLSRRALKSSES